MRGGKDTMVNGNQFLCHQLRLSLYFDFRKSVRYTLLYFLLFFLRAVSNEREVVSQPSESDILENEDTAIKHIQNPYYGVDSDTSHLVDLENTQKIVAKENPYYEYS